MRFIYADPALVNDKGHFANECRVITREFQSRGISTSILGSQNIDKSLQAELDATPLFRIDPYWMRDGDPICGWLNAFHIAAETMKADLSRLRGISAEDVFYIGCVSPALLFALAQWVGTMPPLEVPNVIVDLVDDPGLEVKLGEGRLDLSVGDPRRDARPVLYRFAAQRVPENVRTRIHFVTYDKQASAAYRELLGQSVATLPVPRIAPRAPRNRKGNRPITVSVLGVQRGEKGFRLMPDVARKLLVSREDVKILCHDSGARMPDTNKALSEIAHADPRLILDERTVNEEEWSRLLDQSDLILCPYTSLRFAISVSGLASEALANAIPLVVPAGTTLAASMTEYGGAGTIFDRAEPDSIVDATQRALDQFDALAELAFEGAAAWQRSNGPVNLISAMLGLTVETAYAAQRSIS